MSLKKDSIQEYHDRIDSQLLTVYLAFSLIYSASKNATYDETILSRFSPFFIELAKNGGQPIEDPYILSFVALALDQAGQKQLYLELTDKLALFQKEDGSFPAANRTIMRKKWNSNKL